MNQSQPTRWEALTEAARRCVAEKQFDKAEEAFLAALREAEQFGDADPRVAVTLNALARVYHRRSKFFPAAALLHRLLGIKEREHGEEHPELAGILSNLAEMYARLGDARQELELRERALHIRVQGGEAEGGALEGLRGRIAELKQKLADEKASEEAARNAPPPRIPVPTGATDLPLILPTPLAPKTRALAPAFAPPAKLDPRPATAPRAAIAVPEAPRMPSPAATQVVRPTPAPLSFTGSSAVVEPIGAVAPDVVPAPKWEPIAPPAPTTQRTPIAPPAPAPQWTPIAPPAPVTSWPGEREEVETAAEPDDYVEYAGASQRNWKPIAFGGVAVAALAAAAVLIMGRPETSGSSTGDLAAQPAVSAPVVKPPPPVTNPTEAQALEAGLANLQQEGDPLPPVNEYPAGSSDRAATQSGVSNGDTAREPRLRVSVPTLSLDNVTKSIEAAARARVDSLTEVKDKQVVEYKGKQPRQ